jgi:hypothetical protein
MKIKEIESDSSSKESIVVSGGAQLFFIQKTRNNVWKMRDVRPNCRFQVEVVLFLQS